MKFILKSMAYVAALLAAGMFVMWHENMNDPARDIRLIFVAIIGVVSIAFWEAQSDGSK